MSRFGARLKSWLTTANRVGTVEGGRGVSCFATSRIQQQLSSGIHRCTLSCYTHTHTEVRGRRFLLPRPEELRARRGIVVTCTRNMSLYCERPTTSFRFLHVFFFFLLFFYLLRMRVLSPKCRSLARTSDSLPGRDDGCAKDTLFIFVVEAPLLFVCLEL